MKQILEIGNIATFINNCEKAFVTFSEKTKVLEDYEDYSKYSQMFFVGGETSQFALIDTGKKTIVVKRDDETVYSIVKLENGLFGTNKLNKLYFTKVQQIKEDEANGLRIEAEKKAKDIEVSKSIFRQQVIKYSATLYNMMMSSTDDGEYISEISDEENKFPTAIYKIVLPPLNNKSGKITINLARFTPFGNTFHLFEPDGHANDTVCNLKKTYIETFKKYLNKTNV